MMLKAKDVTKLIKESTETRVGYWRTIDSENGTPVKPTSPVFPQDYKQAIQWTPEEKHIPGRTYTLWKRDIIRGAWSGDWSIVSKSFEVLP